MVTNSATFIFIGICSAIFSGTLSGNNIFRKGIRVDATIPFADELGIVLNTKVVTFKENISNAYNSSIIENKDGYLLIFRHDTTNPWCDACDYTERQLKMVYLNKDFEQTSPIRTIGPTRGVQEDPRVHFLNGDIYVTCNGDVQKPSYVRTPPQSFGRGREFYKCLMALSQKKLSKNNSNNNPRTNARIHLHPVERKLFVGKLDTKKALLPKITQVPSGGIKWGPVEKNWIPFQYPEYDGSLHYIYLTFPHKIIKFDDLDNPKSARRCPTITQDIYSVWQKDVWGDIKGGTPARIVDGVYLTFFHSWQFSPKDECNYYVMGAYIFQDHPPFKILAMTPEPIFFKDIYSTPQRVKHLYQLYPAGFAIERKDDKTLLHVSCGENDLSTRIITIDKDALFKSMVQVPSLKESS